MARPELFTVAQTAQALGLSKAAIRAYASKEVYRRHLSTEATPGQGQERKFTSDDLKLFAFILARTRLGETHEAVAGSLAQGELDAFDWKPIEPTSHVDAAESVGSQLVPYERLQAAQAIIVDARQREEVAQAKIDALQTEVARLQNELGRAQGERDALRRRRPHWWVRLFGE